MDVDKPLFTVMMCILFGITLYMVNDWFKDNFKNKP